MKTLLIFIVVVFGVLGDNITPMVVSESSGVVNFVVTLDTPTPTKVRLNYTITPITALYPSDYTSNRLTGRLRFRKNKTTSKRDIVITIIDNTLCEFNRTFLIRFDNEDFIITIEEDDCQLIFPSPVKTFESTAVQVVPILN